MEATNKSNLETPNLIQWNVPTKTLIGSSVSQIAISETSHKQPPSISDHLSLTSMVVAYGRFHCIWNPIKEKSMLQSTIQSCLTLANSPNHSRKKWLRDVVRNDCSINFHLSKLSTTKFSILYDISLVRDWKRKLKLITLESERVKECGRQGAKKRQIILSVGQVWVRVYSSKGQVNIYQT